MTRYETTHFLNDILTLVGSHGLSGVSSSGNSLLEALDGLGAFPHDMAPADKRALIANIRRQGLVEISHTKGNYTIQPSVKGIHRLQRAKLSELAVLPQKQWDGTWRMVSYDIPARYSKQRRLFTTELHRLGFTLVKDSTWFHPFPCFDAISELVAYCGIADYVMVAEIARIDENSLRKLYKVYPGLGR